MPRTSTVVTLALLGSALALIGWSCYNANEPGHGGRHAGSGFHRVFPIWFWGGGGGHASGGSPGSGGVSTRGGFGGSGGGAAVGG